MLDLVKKTVNRLDQTINRIRATIKDDRYKYVITTSLLFGFLSYIYMMTNNIHNYDNLQCQPTDYGTATQLGRWFILFFGEKQSAWASGTYYNTTVINTMLALFFLMLSCLLLISILELKSKAACVAITAVTISFPTIAATMIFNFTVHIYCCGIFLGTLGVWLGKKKSIPCFILGCLSIAGSLGAYQAYYAYVAMLLLLVLICAVMNQEKAWRQVLILSVKYFALLVVSYVAYRYILRYYLFRDQIHLSDYQGVDQMGRIDIHQIPSLIKKAYSNIWSITHSNYLSMSITEIVQKSIFFLYICILVMAISWIIKNRSLLKSIELITFLSIFPIAADAIELMAPSSWKYSLMGLGMIGVFYLPIIMADNLHFDWKQIKKYAVWATSAVVLIVSLNYCYTTNVNYTALYYNLEVSKNYYIILYSNILSTPGYSADKEVVLTGGSHFQNVPYYVWGGGLTYGGASVDINVYSKAQIAKFYLGQYFRNITSEEQLLYQALIDDMDVYPNEHSIQVVDNLVLIKIAE